ncbi:hypothetical protein [Micromonospora sp. Mcm103]|uniref:hypothetical protein n=1 Tax=Micromonospora sp. Mcm103 TaxID=2926015 RepID=UPI0021C6FF29|nr:hypothetical protein [Micromonospora sp. Mcm103]
MKKITASAPGAYVNGPTNTSEPLGGQPAWFVNGEAYVADNHPFVRYAETMAGYTVSTAASAPQAYTDAVAAMKADGVLRQGSQLRDGAVDPQPGDNFTRLP